MALAQTPFVSAEQINALCSYEQIIENQRQVFKNFYLNEAVMGPRAILSQGENAQFSYIARASNDGLTIVKFGTVVPSNAGRDISVVQTTVSVIDAITGSIKLFLDGEAVTKWRTVCASMAAAKELANPVKKIAVIGMGHQGTAHAIAAKHIFKPEQIIGIDKDAKKSESGIDLTQDIKAAYGCDLIFICTNSQDPVINSALNSGSTCISIGSFAPNRLEVSVEALSKADKVLVMIPKLFQNNLVQWLKRWKTQSAIGIKHNLLVVFMLKNLLVGKTRNRLFIISQSDLASKMQLWLNLSLRMENSRMTRGI
jgi:ornithine cyclodeaminase